MALNRRTAGAVSRTLALGAALLLALPLAACAPEPGDADDAKQKHGENSLEEGESNHPEPPAEATKKQTELPASFPKTEFALPEGAVIDDAGERGPEQWFVVLKADSEDAATKLAEQIATTNGLQDGGVDEQSGLTVLLSPALRVELLMLPGDDSTLLSYEITRAAAG